MHFKLKKTVAHIDVLSAFRPMLPHLTAAAFAAVSRGKHRHFGPRALAGAGTALMVAAMLSACSSSTSRSSGGEHVVKSKSAPTAAAAPAEYEPAQYVEPPPAQPTPPVQPAPPVQQTAETAQAKAEEPEFAPEGDAPDMLPVPSPDSFAADAADDRISEPVMYYDEEAGAVADETIIGVTQFGNDDSGIEPDDGIVSSQYYGDDGAAADDGIVSRQYYGDDGGEAADDGIVSSQVYDDSEAVADDGIVSREVYDDAGAAADDGIVAHQFSDEDTAAVGDDGILAHKEYDDFVDEAQVAQDEEPGFPEFVDDSADTPDEPYTPPEIAEEEVAGEDVVAAGEEQAVAQAEEPARAPVVLPLTITLEAEPLFDFDRSLVRSNERSKLDNLVDGLQGVEYDSIIVVGHADRIGTKRYNQRLSEQRANAVKAYLVKQGLGDERIQAEGRGEFEPATGADVCSGLHKNKLITCLQPDRRVEVTVTGQKPR